MPSADAILGASPMEMSGTYDDMSFDMDEFGTSSRNTRIPNFARQIMGRDFNQAIMMLGVLGHEVDRNSDIMRAIRIMMMTNMAIFGFYRMVKAVRSADRARQLMLASGETAAAANPLLWWKIPLAVGAAVLCATTFTVGAKLGSGDWDFPSVNVSSPSDRRAAERHLQGVSASG